MNLRFNKIKNMVALLLCLIISLSVLEIQPIEVSAASIKYYDSLEKLTETQRTYVIRSIEKRNVKMATYKKKYYVKFTDGNNIICVKADYFSKSQKLKSLSSVSSAVTTKLNTADTDYVYSTSCYAKVVPDNTFLLYKWDLSQYAYQAYISKENTIIVTAEVVHAVSFTYDADMHRVYCYNSLSSNAISRTPTVSVKMTHTGKVKRYFDSMYIDTLGSASSGGDAGDMTFVAVSTALQAASVTTVLGAVQVLSDVLSTASSFSSTKKRQSIKSKEVALSNPKKKVYTYYTSLKTPYAITSKSDHYEMHISLSKAAARSKNSGEKYTVTIAQ